MPEKECPICFVKQEHLISSEECNNKICKNCLFRWYKKCASKTTPCPFCRNQRCFDVSIFRPKKNRYLCFFYTKKSEYDFQSL